MAFSVSEERSWPPGAPQATPIRIWPTRPQNNHLSTIQLIAFRIMMNEDRISSVSIEGS